MRTIGVIGGMSWESTADYFRRVNEIVVARLGGLRSADLLLRSLDFAALEAMQASGRIEQAAAALAVEGARLVEAGAEVLVLATDTLHKVCGPLEEAYAGRFVHVADATAQAILAADAERVGVLGSGFSVSQEHFLDRLAGRGVDPVLPVEADQGTVNRIVHDELFHGVFTEESRQAYAEIVGRLVDAGCEGVVLGSAAIERLLPGAALDGVPLFPVTQIQADAAVTAALA